MWKRTAKSKLCVVCLLHNSFSAVFDNHVSQTAAQKDTHLPGGQLHIYIFYTCGRWAFIAEGLIVFQENRE